MMMKTTTMAKMLMTMFMVRVAIVKEVILMMMRRMLTMMVTMVTMMMKMTLKRKTCNQADKSNAFHQHPVAGRLS